METHTPNSPPGAHRARISLISASLAAGITACGIFGLATAAQAAPAAPASSGPSIVLALDTATVSSGAHPIATFVGVNLPPGTILYLQRGAAPGKDWQNVARTAQQAGTAEVPPDQPGSFDYRMIAIDRGSKLATSADVPLTVTGHPDSCQICRIARDAVPWLKRLEGPILGWLFGKAADYLWRILFE